MTATRPPSAVFAACAALASVSVAALPYVTLRANRAATGAGVTLPTAAPAWFAVLGLLVAVGAAGFALRLHKAARAIGAAAVALLVPAGMLSLGMVADNVAGGAVGPARVSIGIGFWAFTASAYGMAVSNAPALGGRASTFLRAAAAAMALALAIFLAAGSLDGLSILVEYANRRQTFLVEAARHLAYAALSTAAAFAVGVPLGYAASRSRAWERPAFVLANVAQAMPTLSLLGLLIVPLSMLAARFPALGALGIRGVGWAPAAIVLFLYALLPVMANAHAGFRMVEPPVRDAARGMGMGRGSSFIRVELPLAMPAILGGVRTALAQNMGNAVLAGLIGGGGLGSLMFLGLAQAAPDLVMLGVLPVVASALAADRLMAAAERMVRRRAGVEATIHD